MKSNEIAPLTTFTYKQLVAYIERKNVYCKDHCMALKCTLYFKVMLCTVDCKILYKYSFVFN